MDLISQSVPSLSLNNTSSLIQPIMHLFSSALLIGSVALQSIMGLPATHGPASFQARQASVQEFIDFESPIAIQQLLCNIGPDGCHAQGVASGVVIASPDKQDPDCKFMTATYLINDEADFLLAGRIRSQSCWPTQLNLTIHRLLYMDPRRCSRLQICRREIRQRV